MAAPHAAAGGRRSLAPFVLLLSLVVVALLSFGSTPVESTTLLVSPAGYSLRGRPLLLDGVNVGAVLLTVTQQIEELQQKAQQQQTTIDDQQTTITQQQATIDAQQTRIQEEAERNAAQQLQIDALLARNGTVAGAMADFSTQIAQLQQTDASQQTQLDDQQTYINNQQDTILQHAAALEDLQRSNVTLGAALQQAESSIVQLQQRDTDQQTQIDVEEVTNLAQQATIDALVARNATVAEAVTDFSAQIVTLQHTDAAQQTQLDGQQTSINNQQTTITQHAGMLDDLQRSNVTLGAALQQAEASIVQLHQNDTAQQTQIDAGTVTNLAQQLQIDVLLVRNTTLGGIVADFSEQIAQLQHSDQSQQTQIDAGADTNTKQQVQIDALQARNETVASALSDFTAQIAALQHTDAVHQTQLDNQQSNISTQQTQLNTQGGQITQLGAADALLSSQLQQANTTLLQSLAQQGVQIGSLGTTLVQHAAGIDDLQRSNVTLSASLQQAKGSIVQLQQADTNQQAQIDAGAATNTAQQLQIDALLARNVTVAAQIAQLQHTDATHQTQLDIQQGNISTQQTQLNTQGGQITQLGVADTQLSNQLQQTNTTLLQSLAQQGVQIGSLNTKVDALLTPTIVEATAGDKEAEVRWALASTTVTAAPGGATCTTNGLGDAQACKVTGLTNGVSYTFTARLTNAAGAGSASPPSSAVTPGPQCRLLTLSAEGSGTLTATPPNSAGCLASSFAPGASITLIAAPAAGFTLASWSGSLPGPSELQWQWDYTMPDAASVQKATFVQCQTLAVAMVGSGTAIAERSPTSSAGCPTGSYIAGDTLVISLRGFGSTFTRFLSPLVTSANPTTFRMPAAATMLLAEVMRCFPLTTASDVGTVTLSPSKSVDCPEGQFINGSIVSVSVTTPTGYDFSSWTGAATGSAVPLSFVMPAGPASLQAQFRPRMSSSTATFVFGQTSLNEGILDNPALAPRGLNQPMDLALDSAGNLFVSDMVNHRINVYAPDNATPFRVIGQADFNGVGSNRGLGDGYATANSLFSPNGMAMDASDGLYVADNGNNRVLYFLPGADTATRVYGQGGSFTSSSATVSADGLNQPYDVALARDGSGVFIVDAGFNRVLFYPGNSTTPSRVIGQTDFVKFNPACTASGLYTPTGLAPDEQGGLWVSDTQNSRVLYFPAGSGTATRVLGQPDFTTRVTHSVLFGDTITNAVFSPIGLTVRPGGGLYVADYYNSRILYFEPGASAASAVWGQLGNFTTGLPNLFYDGTAFGAPTADTLAVPYFAPAFDKQNRMYVADMLNARVLRFDVL